MPWLEHDTDCPNAQACENRFKFVSAQHQYVSKKDENDKVGPLQRCRKLVVVPAHSAGFCWDYGSLRGWYWGHHLRTWRLGLRHWTALPTLLGLEMAWSAGGLAVAKAFNFHPCNSYEGYQIGTHCVGSLIVFAQLLSKPQFLQGSGYRMCTGWGMGVSDGYVVCMCEKLDIQNDNVLKLPVFFRV